MAGHQSIDASSKRGMKLTISLFISYAHVSALGIKMLLFLSNTAIMLCLAFGDKDLPPTSFHNRTNSPTTPLVKSHMCVWR
jgi:hypothetical protein